MTLLALLQEGHAAGEKAADTATGAHAAAEGAAAAGHGGSGGHHVTWLTEQVNHLLGGPVLSIERAIMPDEMSKAQECFLTGTAAEVTPVSEIGPYRFTPAEVCRNLIADFDVLTGRLAKSSAA